MTNELGLLYGLTLDEDIEGNKQDDGDLICRLKGSYIGPYNVELFVSNYGVSETENDLVHVDSAGQPFVYHTLADVEEINSNSGSVNGGQFLTLSGSGFDENPGQTKVWIGDQECKIESIDSSTLTCLTPPQGNSGATEMWPGNAGLTYELWLDTDVDPEITWDILDGVEPNYTTILDQGN